MTGVQFEAFAAAANKTDFSESPIHSLSQRRGLTWNRRDEGERCTNPAGGGSDLVPIIVGACLAAIVILVLIAYLIGRARARSTGYQSV